MYKGKMTSSKMYFCTFADSRLKRSLDRIRNQALELDVYTDTFVFDETNLSLEFREKFKDKLKQGSRGFGYWCWKPQVILQVLNQINDGDLLQYSDSGCHLNKLGKSRLLEYFDIVKKSESGILSFRSKKNEELIEGEIFYGNLEYKYNKADLLNHFGVLNDNEITHTIQYEAGIIFLRKDAGTVKFIEDWISVFSEDFNLIDDTPSKIPNLSGFLDHRHDQSIYSILCKKNGVEELFSTEYYTDGDWSQLANFPIWVKRDMDYGPWLKCVKFLKKGYKYLKRKINA